MLGNMEYFELMQFANDIFLHAFRPRHKELAHLIRLKHYIISSNFFITKSTALLIFFSAFAFSCFTDLLLSWSFSLRKEAAFSLNAASFSSCAFVIPSFLSEIILKESFFAFSIILCFSASAFLSMASDSSSELLISFRISASFASCILGVEYIAYIKFLHIRSFQDKCPMKKHLVFNL